MFSYMFRGIVAVSFVTLALSGCASAPSQPSTLAKTAPLLAEGQRTKMYKARAIIYTSAPSPNVTEKQFYSDIEISIKGDIKSYKFKNNFGGDPKANIVAQVAFSGPSAGFGIYDHAGSKLAEYTNGKAYGSVAAFDIKTQGGTTSIRWFFSQDAVVSVIEALGVDGRLGYSEITTYSPQ